MEKCFEKGQKLFYFIFSFLPIEALALPSVSSAFGLLCLHDRMLSSSETFATAVLIKEQQVI